MRPAPTPYSYSHTLRVRRELYDSQRAERRVPGRADQRVFLRTEAAADTRAVSMRGTVHKHQRTAGALPASVELPFRCLHLCTGRLIVRA